MSRILLQTLLERTAQGVLVLGLCTVALCGCSSVPETPLEPPDVQGQVHYALLKHPTDSSDGGATEVTFDGARSVTFDAFVLRSLPESALRPLSEQTILALVLDEGRPKVSPLYLARGARAGLVEDRGALLGSLGEARPLMRLSAALPRDVAVEFRLDSSRSSEDSTNPERQHLRIETFRNRPSRQGQMEPEGVSFSLNVGGFGPYLDVMDRGTVPDLLGGAGPLREALRSEVVLTREHPIREELQFAVILLSPFDTEGRDAILAILTIEPSPTPEDTNFKEYTEALAACRGAVETALSTGTIDEADQRKASEARQVEAAFDALSDMRVRRATLAFIARATNASMVEDFALSARQQHVDAFVERIRSTPSTGKTRQELGWLLVSRLLAAVVETHEQGDLTPEIFAILTRHMGEAGRHMLFLEDLLSTCSSLEQIEARLARENTLYLHGASLGARLRAHRWLDERGLAPTGYDPGGFFGDERQAASEQTGGVDLEKGEVP